MAKVKTNPKTVDVAPDISMYDILKNQNYKPAWAISEFIDNSIQAYKNLTSSQKQKIGQLEVILKYYTVDCKVEGKENQLIITDNGAGITSEGLIEAFKPMRKVVDGQLNEFGIGMKSAAVWLAEKWKLQTKPINRNPQGNKYEVDFDLESIKSSQNTKLPITSLDGDIEGIGLSGTRISLENLELAFKDEIFQDIAEIYQKFTNSDDPLLKLKLYIDDTEQDILYDDSFKNKPLNFPKALQIKDANGDVHYCAVGKAKDWKLKISFKFMGKSVNGYLIQRAEGSYKNNPGFSLFRYNRLIKGTMSQPFMPLTTVNKYAAQRVYCELNMDGLPVDYNKEDFKIDFDQLMKKITGSSGYAAIISQTEDFAAQAYKKQGNKKYEYYKSEAQARKTISSIKKKNKPSINPSPPPPSPPPGKPGRKKGTHVNDWSELLPPDFPQTDKQGDIVNSFITEAKGLTISDAPHASAMLYRSMFEAGLLEFVKSSNNYAKVKQHFFTVGDGKNSTMTQVDRQKMTISMKMIIDWLNVNPLEFPDEERSRLVQETKKLIPNNKVFNGVVHCQKIIDQTEMIKMRNDTQYLLRFLVNN
ncbi:MAG: ATP-binding protein [Xanthomonadales bacterium]|nr:ATP-binding protein [Xanthomonadales bacterium]